MKHVYTFSGKVWKDPKANWYFISLDKKLSEKIKEHSEANKYGLIKVEAAVGKTTWDSTLFPTKQGNYVFAVTSVIRKKEKIEDGDIVDFRIIF